MTQPPQPQQAPPPSPPPIPTPTMESVLAEMPNGGKDRDPNDDELFAQYNTQLRVVKEE